MEHMPSASNTEAGEHSLGPNEAEQQRFAGLTVAVALQICSPAVAIPIRITGYASPSLVIPHNYLNGLASTIALSRPSAPC